MTILKNTYKFAKLVNVVSLNVRKKLFVIVDIIYMPMRKKGGYRYLVITRDDFLEWIKARFLVNPNSKMVAKFL
jgi:hypothetical protein